MMRFLVVLAVVFGSNAAAAQKILKLYHGDKALEYRIGDEFHFQLSGQDFFYTFEIKDLDFASQTITFPTGRIEISDIVAVKSYENYGKANAFQKLLYTFGSGWLLFSTIDILYRGENIRQVVGDALIVGSTSFVSGYLLKRYWATKTYPLGNDENLLYIVDLGIGDKK